MSIIELRNVEYAYAEEAVALTKIDLNVEKGEFVCVIGHNGSGKSTLAKLFNGFLIPTKGNVLIDGMDTHDENLLYKIRCKCGMVFQNPDNQLVASVVEDDVAFGPENIGVPPEEIRIRVDNALKTVGMEKFLKKAPNMLSGGQKQRVALAGVLALNPEIIVFDEPTAMLDPKGRKEVLNAIVNLNKNEGKTIVLITHYMEETVYADRIVVLNEGEILLSGTPAYVFAQTDTLSSAKLSPPVCAQISKNLNLDMCITQEELVSEIKRKFTNLCPLKQEN